MQLTANALIRTVWAPVRAWRSTSPATRPNSAFTSPRHFELLNPPPVCRLISTLPGRSTSRVASYFSAKRTRTLHAIQLERVADGDFSRPRSMASPTTPASRPLSTPNAPGDGTSSQPFPPCLLPSPNVPPGALLSCEPIATTSTTTNSSTSDTLDRLPTTAITTMAADPLNPLIGITTPSIASSMLSSSNATTEIPAAPTPPPSATTSSSPTTLETSISTDPTTDPSLPFDLAFDPFSSPFSGYRSGTPPVLAALYVIVIVWTLLFGYAIYRLHRGDEKRRRRRVTAHPQWRRSENLQGQRSPKKGGGRFEIRGMGSGEREREREREREMGVRLGRHGV